MEKENTKNGLEKISDKQFFLLIGGPSCGGKSSVADEIMSRYSNVYNGKYDGIKRKISDYSADSHGETVHAMVMATIHEALKHGLSVIKEGAFFKPNEIKEFAEKEEVPFFVAYIEAPQEILEARFEERVEKKRKNPDVKISNVSHSWFEELNRRYRAGKLETPLEFDSSKESPKEIADKIVSYIRENV